MSQLSISDLSITVVEPSVTQARIIANHLQDLQASHIACFQTGAEALADIRASQPDLVISAMYLPDMTGCDLVQLLRADQAAEDTPFMLISSETSFAKLDPIRQAGVVAILPKPFDPKDLQRALYSTLEFVTPSENILTNEEFERLITLVVDDSALARKHICRVLNQMGITHITTAENGAQAAKLIEQQVFDLVVTDYNMPEMDGEQLTRHIREHSSQRSIPVLMVTSEGSESRLAAVQQAGVSGICDKPFDPISVKQMIANLLNEL